MADTKHRVFVSYYQGDEDEVKKFIEKWAEDKGVFTAYAIGVSDDDEFINSDDPEYVMTQIRKNYMADTTVTIVLVGKCTHSRRYVDWEIKTSLRQGEKYIPNGLLAILLPSAGDSAHLPPRFKDNWNRDEKDCYARCRPAPTSADELRGWIEDAYKARTERAHLIKNSAEMFKYNHKCLVHDVIH